MNQEDIAKYGDELYKALIDIQEKKLVKKIGVSVYSPEELELLAFNFDFDVIQLPFSIVDNRFLETGWFAKLYNQNKEIHARSVFLQGLLLMNNDRRPKKFNKWKKFWSFWDNWLDKSNLSALEATIRYVLSFEEIKKVIVGVNSTAQLAEIIDASSGPKPLLPKELSIDDNDLLIPINWNKL